MALTGDGAHSGQSGGKAFSVSISVVVPALNEAATLKEVVEWTMAILSDLAEDYEVVIVDDGSTDATGRIADELATGSPRVRVVHTGAPSGYGGALHAGFRVANKEVIGIITGDREFHPTDLPRFVAAIQHADFVSSVVPHRPMPLYRKFLSWGWRLCIALILGERPILEGVFMIRRDLFRAMSIESRTGMYVMEMLIRARRLGARIEVIETRVYPRPDMSQSKVANLRSIIDHLREIIALRHRLSASTDIARSAKEGA
jgi:glycosyltransferase involved in cell wall biosynthesis